jgi:hypothetical protein
MQKIILKRNHRAASLSCETMNADINWVANEERYAMVRVRTDIGISCILHISPNVQGSIFDFSHAGLAFSLSIDRITVVENEIVGLVFWLETDGDGALR